MDDSGHRDNGRHKQLQSQWLMQQPSMKQIMAIMAERDAAIQERNLAMSEKKAALAERDMAILQRDAAITERNTAILERDNAIATLQYSENSMNSGNMSPCPPGCQISRGVKHMHHHPQQYMHHQSEPHMTEAPQSMKEMNTDDTPLPLSQVAPEPPKPKRKKQAKEPKPLTDGGNKKTPKAKRVKKETDDLNITNEWKDGNGMSGGGGIDDLNQQLCGTKLDWKARDLGLNHVVFDETTMPVPVCSCTGTLRPCYKWGNGGWQSSCCTTTMSMYPLPSVPNKKHARIGGRKMSGSAFNKLLGRLAGDGHDLSNAVDLKDHWAKHGTNRYITIR